MVDDHIVGLQDGRVRLVPHSPEWARLFAAEKQRLLVALAPFLRTIVLDIQHVGSTSIPGIPAKPIIDIGIAVTDHDTARVTIEPLEELGYVYLGEHEVPGRHFFYLGDASTTGRTHHLHMLEQTNPQWRQQIGFRDYLTAHPATAAAYGELKTELAAQYAEDRPAYLEGKADFITQVLRLSVPEQPLRWTTVHDTETGLRFDYSQDVVDGPLTLYLGRNGGSRRLHLMTGDAQSLYFELAVFEQDGNLETLLARLRDDVAAQYDGLEASAPFAGIVGGQAAHGFRFSWATIRREARFVEHEARVFRFIFDPRGPLNWAILESVTWSPPAPDTPLA